MIRLFSVIAAVIVLVSCEHVPESGDTSARSKVSPPAATNSGRYAVAQDFSPDTLLDPNAIQDAIPREEYVTKAGNKSPYTVLGKTYSVLPTSKGYKAEGGASWYGLKFHGFKTSNGETYDIYQMTAAHKTLPIPCYVKVTNLENGKTAVVRVNDRGPFHEGRIIDLSYAAATKLGMINKGSAQVRVEAIDPKSWQGSTVEGGVSAVDIAPQLVEQQVPSPVVQSSTQQPQYVDKPVAAGYIHLQVGAYVDKKIAEDVVQKLKPYFPQLMQIESGQDSYYRVKIGPVTDEEVDSISQELIERGYPKPMRVK